MRKPPRPGPETTRQAVDPARGRGGVPPDPKRLKTLNSRAPVRPLGTAVSYRRVSKGSQDPENQRADVELVARLRGLELVGEYVETASAARTRPAFDAMMRAARRGEFRVLVVWALDRFGRSMVGNINAVLELDRLGVEVISVREPWLDMEGPVRSLLLAVFSWVAEQERARIVERTNAGLARARAKGVKLGRPARRVDLAHVRRLRAAGYSWRQVARRLGVSDRTLRRSRAAAPAKNGSSGTGD